MDKLHGQIAMELDLMQRIVVLNSAYFDETIVLS